MLKIQKNEQGFTLVELMVVVAIIGILVAVAIPQYAKYQAKSRQTEAKVELGSVYTAETSFSVENGSFTGCLGSIGANPTGANFYYTYGFTVATSAAANCGPAGGLTCLDYQFGAAGVGAVACVAGNLMTFFDATATARPVASGGQAPPTVANFTAPSGATLTTSTFNAAAVGQVSSVQNVYDQWTMSDSKVLINTVNAL